MVPQYKLFVKARNNKVDFFYTVFLAHLELVAYAFVMLNPSWSRTLPDEFHTEHHDVLLWKKGEKFQIPYFVYRKFWNHAYSSFFVQII